MQSMSVRPEQVNALAAQIRSGSQGIRSELDRLESEVGKLRAAWDGSAQQAYDQAQAKWNRSLSEMQQLLTQIAGKTEEISGQYVHTHTPAAGVLGALSLPRPRRLDAPGPRRLPCPPQIIGWQGRCQCWHRM